MSRLGDYEFKGLPQDVTDFKDDVRDHINSGKMQMASSSGSPNFVGNRGEMFYSFIAGSGRFWIYTAETSGTTGWTLAREFPL